MTSEVRGSRDERVNRLRARLQEDEVSARAGGRVRSSRGAGVLFGAMLHGAARWDEGLELTDLESTLVGLLQRVSSDDEVREAGRVYREEASVRNAPELFPESIAARPLERGYSFEDLFADLPALVEEIRAQPNVNVIDLDAAEDEGGADSEEFRRGMLEYGYGATVVTASGHESAGESTAAVQTRLALSKLYSAREDWNEWSGSDEIYYALAAGADGGARQSSVTRTYEDVDEGETHYMDVGTILFEGPVDKVLLCHIECWEEDQKADAKLAATLREIADMLQVVSDRMGAVPGQGADYMALFVGVASAVANVVATIIEWLADDLVAQRVLEFDRAALAALAAAPGGETRFDFYGNGTGGTGNSIQQRLFIRSGPPPALPRLADGWPGLRGTSFASGIGAACPVPGSRTDVYLFKGADYVRYNASTEKVVSNHSIHTGWPGLRGTAFLSGLDAAVGVPGSNTDVYLFKGANYVRYNASTEKVVSNHSIHTGWPGLRGTAFLSGLDAAVGVPGSNTDVYLFKGANYVRYNASTERIDGSPRSIADNWAALRGTALASNIDAGVVVPGSNTDVYLFKGADYVRYNASTEKVVSNHSIHTGWPGLRGTAFLSGLDAAVGVPGSNTDVYLFKGANYVRYNASTERIDGSPRSIADNWAALRGTALASNIDAGVVVPGSTTEVYLFKGDAYIRTPTRH